MIAYTETLRNDRVGSFCPTCDEFGCDADCPLAPWNHDKPQATRFVYLMRKRRWAGFPVRFCNRFGRSPRFS